MPYFSVSPKCKDEIVSFTSPTLSSTSGRRSRKHAAMKTPPAKQEAKLITSPHLKNILFTAYYVLPS